MLNFRGNPRIAVIAPEKLIGFLVFEDLLLVAVPLEAPTEAIGNHAKHR